LKRIRLKIRNFNFMTPHTPRLLLLLALTPLLPACQSAAPRPATSTAADTPAPHTFNQDTVQTYDLQTGEFQQQPPFGARSDRAQ
jgi:hypothetical protein